MWYRATVLQGQKTGRIIGFPTINLEASTIPDKTQTGVYSSIVKYAGTTYKGALYYGPRLVKNETKNVLEIHILDFNKEIYGEEIEFKLSRFIRVVQNFSGLEDLKHQLQIDISTVRQMDFDI